MKLLISILILAFSFFICYNFDNSFQGFSNRITIRLQNLFAFGNCDGIVECMLYACSVCGDRTFSQFFLLLFWVKAENKSQILKLIIMYSLATFTGDFVKMILREPRPFYITDEILLDFCFTGFGGPSGHALRSLVFYVLMADNLLNQKYTTNFQEYPGAFKWKILLGFFLVFAGLARMYFGVHFLHQIVFGWILGGYLLYLYYYCYLENFLDQKLFKAINSTHTRICKSSLLKRGIFLILIIIVSFLLYFELKNSDQLKITKQQWKKFVNLQFLCTSNDQFYNNTFENHDIIGTSIIVFPFFLYYCMKLSNLARESMRGTQKIPFIIELLRISIIILLLTIVYQGRTICRKIFFLDQILIQYIIFGLGYYLLVSLILMNVIPFLNKLLNIRNLGLEKNQILEQSEIEL